jgi:predicted small metal-binding protein
MRSTIAFWCNPGGVSTVVDAGPPAHKEVMMTRKYIDCREYPSEMNCSVALSADSDKELLEAAVQHAVSVHKHEDSPELRSQLKMLFHEGTPPAEAPHHA